MSAPAPLKPLDAIKNHPERLILDWIGGVYPNPQDSSNPLIECLFTPLLFDKEKELKGEYPYKRSLKDQLRIGVGAGYLPAFYTGQVFFQGKYLPTEEWWPQEELEIKIDITNISVNEVTFASPTTAPDSLPVKNLHSDSLNAGLKCLSGHVVYTSKTDSPQAKASHESPIPMDVLIPEIEIIRFYYASSTHMAKTLLRGELSDSEWLDVLTNKEERPYYNQEDNCARLVYRHNFSKCDIPTLIRILFDPSLIALRGAQRVCNSIAKSRVNHSHDGQCSYPRTHLPFSGKSTLQLLGYRRPLKANKGERPKFIFIAHRIVSCSASFPVTDLSCCNETQRGGKEAGPEAPTAFPGFISGARPPVEDPFGLGVSTSIEPPTSSFGSLETHQSTKRFPGFDKVVVRFGKERDNTHRGGAGRIGRPHSSVSTGDPTTGSSGSTALKIKDDPIQTPGTTANFREFLEVLDHIGNIKSDWSISTIDVGHAREDEETGVRLSLFPAVRNDKRSNTYMQFSFIDKEKTVSRQLICVEIKAFERYIYLLEAESLPILDDSGYGHLGRLSYAFVHAPDGRRLGKSDFSIPLILTVRNKTWPSSKDYRPLIIEKRNHSESSQTIEQIAFRLISIIEVIT